MNTDMISELQAYVAKARAAIAAIEKLEELGVIPAGTVVPPSAPAKKTPSKDTNGRIVRAKADRAQRSSPAGMRTCNKCRAEKPLDEFCKNKACAGGRTYECKECAAKRGKARWKKHQENKRPAPSGPLPFKCEECTARFGSRQALDDHVEVKHG